jgi:hypothetical protein
LTSERIVNKLAATVGGVMSWIISKFKWVMLLSGALTITMLYAAIAPQAALQSTFGETLDGGVAEIVVRSWGALIALVGAMLIYGAYRPASRPLILTVAALSKLNFVVVALIHGRPYMGQQLGVSVVADSVMVLLFAVYLIGTRRGPVTA